MSGQAKLAADHNQMRSAPLTMKMANEIASDRVTDRGALMFEEYVHCFREEIIASDQRAGLEPVKAILAAVVVIAPAGPVKTRKLSQPGRPMIARDTVGQTSPDLPVTDRPADRRRSDARVGGH